MKIYIDFDDIICETARYFSFLAAKMFDIHVPYEEMKFFNLQQAFDLNDEQYDELLKAGHFPETLLAFEETPGASETINKWIDEGHEIFIVTGRPFNSYEPSREWLDKHKLERAPLYCVDKYGREKFYADCSYSMTLEQFYVMTFDFAIEDSPSAFCHLLHFGQCKVAVFNRPWNVTAELPNDNFTRCGDWKEIIGLLEKLNR